MVNRLTLCNCMLDALEHTFGCVEHYICIIAGLVSSVRRALASKLRGPGFNSRPGTVGGPATIIMWGAQPGWKLALS